MCQSSRPRLTLVTPATKKSQAGLPTKRASRRNLKSKGEKRKNNALDIPPEKYFDETEQRGPRTVLPSRMPRLFKFPAAGYLDRTAGGKKTSKSTGGHGTSRCFPLRRNAFHRRWTINDDGGNNQRSYAQKGPWRESAATSVASHRRRPRKVSGEKRFCCRGMAPSIRKIPQLCRAGKKRIEFVAPISRPGSFMGSVSGGTVRLPNFPASQNQRWAAHR